jgi:hypothetical protein
LRDLEAAQDILHEDKDRTTTLYFKFAGLTGAIKDAVIVMDKSSKWIAAADLNITILGNISVAQINAPKGAVINAIAEQ